MIKATLTRFSESVTGTKGNLVFDGGFSCKTLELPWRENKRSISCIPAGEYFCSLYPSSKFGLTYILEDVPERSAILIHQGNYAGDTSKGLKSDVNGCILVGEKFGTLNGQSAVLNSRKTLLAMKEFLKHEPFELTIIDETSK